MKRTIVAIFAMIMCFLFLITAPVMAQDNIFEIGNTLYICSTLAGNVAESTDQAIMVSGMDTQSNVLKLPMNMQLTSLETNTLKYIDAANSPDRNRVLKEPMLA